MVFSPADIAQQNAIRILARLLFGHTLFVDLIAFAGSEEEVRFEAVLARVEVVVAAAEREELRVVAALDNAALLRRRGSGRRGEWWKAGGRSRMLSGPASAGSRPLWIIASDSESSELVASSRIRMRGSASSARQSTAAGAARRRASRRARPRSCRSFSGNRSANSSTRAVRQAKRNCSSVASGRENMMFSRMVPSKRNESCSTTPSCER